MPAAQSRYKPLPTTPLAIGGDTSTSRSSSQRPAIPPHYRRGTHAHAVAAKARAKALSKGRPIPQVSGVEQPVQTRTPFRRRIILIWKRVTSFTRRPKGVERQSWLMSKFEIVDPRKTRAKERKRGDRAEREALFKGHGVWRKQWRTSVAGRG